MFLLLNTFESGLVLSFSQVELVFEKELWYFISCVVAHLSLSLSYFRNLFYCCCLSYDC